MLAEECGSSSDGRRQAAVELDLRGLKCPLPVLRTRKALRRLPAGATLAVTCTDPLAALDIPHLVATEGHCLLDQDAADGMTRFVIVKRA